MTHIVANQNLIFKSFWDSCLKVMASYLSPNERSSFYSCASTTLVFGLTHNLENACITNMDYFLRHIVGETNKIDIPRDVCDEITSEPLGSLTVIHNHPNSTAPSCNDYKFFLTHISLKNMAVCGHRGNLYFIKKGKLFYQEATDVIDLLCVALQNVSRKIWLLALDFHGYSVDEIGTASEEIQTICINSAMEILFVYTCRQLEKYGFRGYRKG